MSTTPVTLQHNTQRTLPAAGATIGCYPILYPILLESYSHHPRDATLAPTRDKLPLIASREQMAINDKGTDKLGTYGLLFTIMSFVKSC